MQLHAPAHLIRQLRSLASQLHHILLATALLPTVISRLSRQMEEFMENHLISASKAAQIQSAEQAASALVAYQVHLRHPDTILAQFAKMTRRNAISWNFRHQEDELPDCGIETLES